MHTSDTDLSNYLEVLTGIPEDQRLDYEEIGKIFVAAILRQNKERIGSEKPDSEGHIRIESSLRYRVALHTDPSIRVCCTCTLEDGIIVCRGPRGGVAAAANQFSILGHLFAGDPIATDEESPTKPVLQVALN
jgi:hypothetical protein